MPTVISHAVAGAALIAAFPERTVPRRLLVAGAVCAMLPDLDVIGFRLGIRYADFLGHRGFTHSLAFAFLLACVVTLALYPRPAPPVGRGWVWLYLFLATASHGLLDACTNGGLGVALFSPFDARRQFFAARPILVSPIGGGFFSQRGLATLWSEVQWVWLPSLAFAVLCFALRYRLPHRRRSFGNTPPA